MKIFLRQKTKLNVSDTASKYKRYIILCAALVLSTIVLFITSFYVGRFTGLNFVSVPKILLSNIFSGIEQTWSRADEAVVMQLRLPRIVGSLIVGASLALSGAAYQALFANPVASPDTLGVGSSAAFGAILGILLNLNGVGIKGLAFVTGCFAVFTVFFFASSISKGRQLTVYLILIGMIVSSVFSALLSILKYVADPIDQLPKITYWLMGSMSHIQLDDLPFAIVFFLIGAIPLLLLRWRINLLSLGDHEVRTLGENINVLRGVTVFCATLLTSSAIALTGTISWIGLVVPHMVRMIVGHDSRFVLPASALMGGVFLLFIDNLARSMTAYELPISVLTSIIGAPIFFVILFKSKGKELQ